MTATSRFILSALVPLSGWTGASGAPCLTELTGPQIRAAISDKYVTDEHHWGHKYFSDGRVERSENGRHRPARWSIKGDRLCLLQPEISKDELVCYRVVRIGDELQYRDDHFVAYRGLLRPMPKKD